MSGVLGFVDSTHTIDASQQVQEMIRAMSHREWYVGETVQDRPANLALGHIGIGIFNQAPQPHWNSGQTVALFMAGELHNHEELALETSENEDERIILSLYLKMGMQAIQRLKGAFLITIWDKREAKIYIINDHFATYQLFYSLHGGRLVFAPEMKGVLCNPALPHNPDITALAQYMRFQHLYGDRTFFEDIRLLPPASILTYDLSSRQAKIEKYWSYAEIPYRPNVTFEEAVEETGQRLRRAVHRAIGGNQRHGVYLSGGLDSRTLLGLADQKHMVSITYGEKNCRDVFYAERIAKAAGSDHYWVDLPNGEWVRENVDFHLELTEGYHSWIHAHGISALPLARQLMDINLSGWDGGTVMGHNDCLEPLSTQAVDDTAFLTRMFYLHNQQYTWPSITEAEERFLYVAPVWKKIHGLALESFREELTPYLGLRKDMRNEYFCVDNHCRRLTQNMIVFARSHIEVRYPFFDYDLIDFLYSLPATVRGHRVLYNAVIQKEVPRMARIPYDHDEMLPTDRRLQRALHILPRKITSKVNRYLWNVFPEHSTLYADYESYLRKELRPWAETILFDDPSFQDPFFDPAFVHTLMNRHLSGLEEWTIGKIAPIITYKMMLKRFC